MIEELNKRLTNYIPVRQEHEPTQRINKGLIETIRDYLNYHDLDYKAMVERQLKRTSKFCKTVKP